MANRRAYIWGPDEEDQWGPDEDDCLFYVEVHAFGAQKPGVAPLLNDNVVISIRFADGSVASVVYTADGSKAQAKERIEVFGGGRAAVIDDFRRWSLSP